MNGHGNRRLILRADKMPNKEIIKINKKSDVELWGLLSRHIENGNYIFAMHAKERAKERGIIDIDVLDILECKRNRQTTRNKKKDIYIPGRQDWNYCVEGKDLSNKKLRIIFSFENDGLIVITLIRIE